MNRQFFYVFLFLFHAAVYISSEELRESLDYGISAKNDGKVPISNFFIVRERCSGTNYLHHLILRNFEVSYSDLGHKHFPPWYQLPEEYYQGDSRYYSFMDTEDHLIFVVFRNPYDWIRSLYRNPHCIEFYGDPNKPNRPFSTFIRSVYQVLPDHGVVMNLRKVHPSFDKNPENGLAFENIIKYREKQIENMLFISERAPNVYFVNYETLRDQPEKVIEEIRKIFPIQGKDGFFPVPEYKGWGGHFAYSFYEMPSKKDLDFINSNLCEELENSIGYYLNCEF